MKHLLIAGVVLWALFHVAEIFLSSKSHPSDGVLTKLLEAPQHSITNPYHNRYFYLFGLTAAASLDPGKTGYEIWVERSEEARRGGLDKNGSSPSDLTLAISPELTATAWEADEPLNGFRKKASPLQTAADKHQFLLSRYDHWLGMPFEDWGFGHRVSPRHQGIMATHRLYVAKGFVSGPLLGLERLHKELPFWRMMLREARTIGTTVLAQVVINDDIQLLSRILAQPWWIKPFTGLPMLWSPTQRKVYSVGDDRLDDGSDPAFDISVPVIVAPEQIPAKAPVSSIGVSGTARR